MDKKILYIIVVVIMVLIAGKGLKSKTMSVLPPGQYNQYKDASGNCVYTTNVDPVGSRYYNYSGRAAWDANWGNYNIELDAWIAIDYDRDGTHDKFGWAGHGAFTPHLNPGELLVENYNPEGDDIYFAGYVYLDNVRHAQIRVVSAGLIGNQYHENFFFENVRVASNAIPCPNIECTTIRNSLINYIQTWVNNPISDNRLILINKIREWINCIGG